MLPEPLTVEGLHDYFKGLKLEGRQLTCLINNEGTEVPVDDANVIQLHPILEEIKAEAEKSHRIIFKGKFYNRNPWTVGLFENEIRGIEKFFSFADSILKVEQVQRRIGGVGRINDCFQVTYMKDGKEQASVVKTSVVIHSVHGSDKRGMDFNFQV